MSSTKIERINAEFKKQLSQIMAYELHDPRIIGISSILKVDTDSDLKVAKVYVSVLGADGKEAEVIKAFNGAEGFIKSLLKKKVDIRALPEFRFILDTSIEYGIKISQILHDINKKPE